MKVTEESFSELVLASIKPVLVFFYREKGCSFCSQMKPVVESYASERPDIDVAWYEIGEKPDSVTQGLVEKFPTFAAYKDGKLIAKQEGVLTPEQLDNTFDPSKIPPKAVPVEKATMLQLITDEANITDQIAPLMSHLKKIQKEIKRRKDLVNGKEACCDSCADGGECEGCH